MYATKIFRYFSRVTYHPPGACDLTTTNHIITSIDDTIKKHPHTCVVLLGDFNNLNDTQLRSYPLKQVVRLPRRAAILNKTFTNINSLYDPLKAFAPGSFSDHNIVVYEPSTSFRFIAFTTIDIDIRFSGPKAKMNFFRVSL